MEEVNRNPLEDLPGLDLDLKNQKKKLIIDFINQALLVLPDNGRYDLKLSITTRTTRT